MPFVVDEWKKLADPAWRIKEAVSASIHLVGLAQTGVAYTPYEA